MVATNGKLELVKRQRIGNECLARGEINGDAINDEAWNIVKSQMSDGRY